MRRKGGRSMKKRALKILLIMILFILEIGFSECYGVGNVSLIADKASVKEGEEVILSLVGNGVEISAFQTELVFNSEKLEYKKTDENSAVIGNRIRTVWFEKTGGEEAKKEQILATYKLKAKKIGNVALGLQGEFYDKNGNKLEVETIGTNINVISQIEEEKNTDETNRRIE